MDIVRADRPHAVRRQLRGMPWIERAGRPGLPQSDDVVLAVGRRSREYRRNHPRRHQLRASRTPASSQMPAFGRDQMLPQADVDKVVSLRAIRSPIPQRAKKSIPTNVDAGKAVFAANCVACHGDDAKGNPELGAPNLTDQFWIYGGDARDRSTRRSGAAVRATCRPGKAVCPSSIARS